MGLTCQPVLYTTAESGSGYQGHSYLFKSQLCEVLFFRVSAICLSLSCVRFWVSRRQLFVSFICIFLGLGDFFKFSFLILIADTLCFVYVAGFQHL